LKNFTLLFVFFILSKYGISQPWSAEIKISDPNKGANFFEIQTAFNSYWENKTPEKGDGYKPFKRWEWFWEPRVGQSGEFPPSDINYTEWQKFKNNEAIYKKAPVKTQWTFMGPSTTPGGYDGLGRLNCVTFHPTDPNIMWVGSPGGGIWKTTDMGVTWTPLSDYNGVLGVSGIAVNPKHTDSIYIATGDGDRGSLFGLTGGSAGDNKSIGVLLSTDGGLNWKPTGLNWTIAQTKLLSRIIMNPNNPKQLFVAASDGIFVTNDAGLTWTNKQSGYFMDITFAPNNPSIIYATTYDYFGNAKMYRSINGGNTFTQTFILSSANRIAIGTTPANPKKVMLLLSDKDNGRFGGIYQSFDTGRTFTVKYDTSEINLLSSAYNGKTKKGQGWYDLAFCISPLDENLIFVGGVNIWKSTNGADSFKINTMWSANATQNPKKTQVTHADKHFMAYNPVNGYLFDCNDGGIYYSTNEGNSWNMISNGLGIMQFYRMSIIESDTNMVLAGAQDNGTKVRRGQTWFESTGGDGMDCAIDPEDPNVFYSGIQYGKINRTNNGVVKVISDNIKNKPKGAWVTPYVIDPNDHNTLYAGYKAIYKTSDQGETWVPICDSLWKPNYVINIAVAEGNSQIIYASDFYKIYKTTNGGAAWTLITSTSIPITNIKIHPKNPHVFYYTLSSYVASGKVYRINSLATGVEKSTNLTLNLPNVAINCIVFDKDSKESLYIGTDVGVFYKDTAMGAWESLNTNLPNVVVTELEINQKERLLYAATFGRGVWKTKIIMDPKLVGPVIKSIEPGDNSSKIHPNSQLIIYFNEPIKKGYGIISLLEGGIEKQRINVESDSVIIEEGNKIIITPGPFALGKSIVVKFPKGTIIDLDGNDHKGILTNTEWNFSITTDTKVATFIANIPARVSPNPTHGKLNIEALAGYTLQSIFIYNSLGALVLEKDCQDNKQCDIDLSNNTHGIYNLVLSINGKLYSKRLVVE
jgi:photosystem II stability/assembly factor-like uncharacterized protein